MEQTKAGNQGLLWKRFNNAITILLAIVVTLAVSLTIFEQWRTYDGIKKVLAVGLLLNLASGALTIIMQLRQGITTKPDVLLKIAYVWLLLATLLFNR